MVIPIPVPIGTDYSASVRGSVYKGVRCEDCGAEYVYEMTRRARGNGTSFLFLDNAGAQGRAFEEARQRLARKLVAGCDPVPCPACGHYQAAMVALLRRRHARWMTNLAAVCLFAALMALLVTIISVSSFPPRANVVRFSVLGLALSVGVAVVLWAGRRARASAFDPNAGDVDARLTLGRSRAVLRADLERLDAEESTRTAVEDGV